MKSARFAAGAAGWTCLLVLLASNAAEPQPASPPPPDKYKAVIRYHIPALRDEHVVRYKAMVEHLASVGFDFQPPLRPFPNTDYEDRGKNMLTGFIKADKALLCLAETSVASLLLMPPDYKIPEDPMQPVRVRLELAGGLPASRQLVLANQVRVLLGQLGFQESVGYDDRGYAGKPHTRIVGTIAVEQLLTLFKDLRSQPTGWLEPLVDPATLPSPLSQFVPIIVTEVLAESTPAADAPAPAPRGQPYLDKITPDLWSMVVSKEDDTKIVRVEIVLSQVPAASDESYQATLAAEAPSLFIEGRLGPIVTASVRVNQAGNLAGLPQVSVIRLARTSLAPVDAAIKIDGDNARALKQSGLDQFHQRGFKGKGVRLAVIDSDFRGYQALVTAGKLPKSTRLVDLTTAFNFDLYPDPQAPDDKVIGHGAHCALAAALAAPDVELTLIRIDPASLHQIQLVARAINSEMPWDNNIGQRWTEIQSLSQMLSARRDVLAQERQRILDNFEDDSELRRRYEILGPAIRGWLFTPREWLFLRLAELDAERERLKQLENRFHLFYSSLKNLAGIQIVSTSLVWNDGYPLGGGSALSKWFEQSNACKAIWFASAGNTQGQSWTGSFRDANSNGIMEFTGPASKLADGHWTPELNFLSWQPYEGATAVDLPAGAKVRITAQWQEPHDPSYFWNPKDTDFYLKPLAMVDLLVLRQRDPGGKLVPADAFEVVARTSVAPFRIDNQPSGSVYEQVVEFTVLKPGRFALQVQRQLPSRWLLVADPASGRPMLSEVKGLAPTGIRPLGVPTLTASESQWELRPRLFVGVTDAATASKGRVIFRDFWTPQGSIPILADTRSLIGVGAMNWADRPQPYSSAGSPGTLWNFNRPNVYAYDALALTSPGAGSAYGASLATPFAAGGAATLLSAGEKLPQLKFRLQNLQGATWKLAK